MRFQVVLLVLCGVVASYAHADSIYNFDNIAASTTLPLTLTSNGITATFTEDFVNKPFLGSSPYSVVAAGRSAPSYLAGNSLYRGPLQRLLEAPLYIYFSQTLTSLSFDFASTGLGAYPVNVNFLLNGQNVQAFQMYPAQLPGSFYAEGVVAYTGQFDSVRIDDIEPYYLDNFRAAATPEPCSFALLGTGALGLIGLAKRRLG